MPHNRTKTVKAVFKGANGSCGYETGKEYTLKITHPRTGAFIEIEEEGRGGFCDYETLMAFLDNWDNVRVL